MGRGVYKVTIQDCVLIVLLGDICCKCWFLFFAVRIFIFSAESTNVYQKE
jgi:hypothetical protein